jgi:hypothetical protein
MQLDRRQQFLIGAGHAGTQSNDVQNQRRITVQLDM